MGKKQFYIMYNVGKVKYLMNYHNGISKHKDGSDFYDVATFKNKKELKKFRNDLLKRGYTER